MSGQYWSGLLDEHAEVMRLRALNAELVACLEEHVRDFGDNEDDDSQRMRDKALAVLAKAKGEA